MKIRLLNPRIAGVTASSSTNKRGRKASLDSAVRFCFFIPVKDKEVIQGFIDDAKALDKNLKYSFAFIFREGARKFINYERHQMKLAAEGRLHVKSRDKLKIKTSLIGSKIRK